MKEEWHDSCWYQSFLLQIEEREGLHGVDVYNGGEIARVPASGIHEM